MSMIEKIKQLAAAYNDEAVGIRHYIHAHPELSFVEHNTMAFVAQQLTAWGINHQTGIAGTGIIALIEGENPHSACVGLRCELDALPIQEANEDVSYRSVNPGVMHACGHDVHTSCLLGAAKILHSTRSQWQGTVKLLIQPGEEKHPGGASLMIKDGALENPKPEALFALHVYPHLSAGNLGFRAGQYMASADEIYITIHGKGGHAALPHQTLDPIAAAAQVITGLQQ
ncbi:MAG: amidohydrolase, partial [Chitinophagia bacterium]|nr:amidohydrolase [Chitinophagia bacterium]